MGGIVDGSFTEYNRPKQYGVSRNSGLKVFVYLYGNMDLELFEFVQLKGRLIHLDRLSGNEPVYLGGEGFH